VFTSPAPEALAAFAALAAVAIATPGPSMAVVAAHGARGGARGALAAVAGVACSNAGYTLLVAGGLAAALAALPGLMAVVQAAGVVYLFYAALRFARAAWMGPAPGRPGIVRAPTPWGALAAGVAVGASNPANWWYYALFLPTFADAGRGPVWSQVLVLGLTSMAIAVVLYGAVGLAAARAGRAMAYGRWARWMDALAAALFAACGVWFAAAWAWPT
jgi:threonine/homoserine/homoserine lactone efflux protein